MSTEEIKVKSEPTDIEIPENFFDDLSGNTFLDELVSKVIPKPKNEPLSDGEIEDDDNGHEKLYQPPDENIPSPEERKPTLPPIESDNNEKSSTSREVVTNDKTPSILKVASFASEATIPCISTVTSLAQEPPPPEPPHEPGSATECLPLPQNDLTPMNDLQPKNALPVANESNVVTDDNTSFWNESFSLANVKLEKPSTSEYDIPSTSTAIPSTSGTPSLLENSYSTAIPSTSGTQTSVEKPKTTIRLPKPISVKAEPMDTVIKIPKPMSVKPEPMDTEEPESDSEPLHSVNDDDLEIPVERIKREKSVSPPIEWLPFKKIKLEKRSTPDMSHVEKAYQNVVSILKKLRLEKEKKFPRRFIYTPTTILMKNPETEYESPLTRNNNIEFNFTSTNSKIDTKKFGLVQFSPQVTEIVKLLGLDINEIANQVFRAQDKHSSDTEKSKRDTGRSGQYYAPFYNEVSTQTETIACSECLARSLRSTSNKASQARPTVIGSGTQTNRDNELPVMSLISTLNASQLLALNDFAEVIKMPAPSDPNEVYRLRERLMDIFNLSQKPIFIKDDPRMYEQQTTHMNPLVQNMHPHQSHMAPQPVHQPNMLHQQPHNMMPNPYAYHTNQPVVHHQPGEYIDHNNHMINHHNSGYPHTNHQPAMHHPHMHAPQQQGYPQPHAAIPQPHNVHPQHIPTSVNRSIDDPRRRPKYPPQEDGTQQKFLKQESTSSQSSNSTVIIGKGFGRGGKVMRK